MLSICHLGSKANSLSPNALTSRFITMKVHCASTPLEIPRNIDDDDAPRSAYQQNRFQQVGAPVVHQVFPPVAYHKLRHQHADLVVFRLLFRVQDVVHHWMEENSPAIPGV